MKYVENINCSKRMTDLLRDIKRKLLERFTINQLILYGSTARGDAEEESDIDILVLTSKPLTRFERHEITDVVFEFNLEHGTNISTLVVDSNLWERGIFSILPIRHEIINDGILL